MQTKKEELKRFLDYILDKVEDCYYAECKKAMEEFLDEYND